MITFQEEAFSAFAREAVERGLFQRHYEEIAQFKDIQKLDPDWLTYAFYEKTGKLFSMTVRDDEKLVGYIVFVISNHMHYKQLKSAIDDMHFVDKSHRRGLIGYKLLKLAIAGLRKKDVQFCCLRTKAGKSHAKLFERLGFAIHDLVYAANLCARP